MKHQTKKRQNFNKFSTLNKKKRTKRHRTTRKTKTHASKKYTLKKGGTDFLSEAGRVLNDKIAKPAIGFAKNTLAPAAVKAADFGTAASRISGKVADSTAKFGVLPAIGVGVYAAKLGTNIGTDWLSAQIATVWRWYKSHKKIIVFGLFGYREAQKVQKYGNIMSTLTDIQALLNGRASVINSDIKDLDLYWPTTKEWVYPNFHDEIPNAKLSFIPENNQRRANGYNVFITPIGVGSVFRFKKGIDYLIDLFGSGDSKSAEITDVGEPTGLFIVVNVNYAERGEQYPTQIDYREIRWNATNYCLGVQERSIKRGKNTVRIWRQIRVFELNIDLITNDYKLDGENYVKKGGGNHNSKKIVGGNINFNGNNMLELDQHWYAISKNDSTPRGMVFYYNKTTNESTWQDLPKSVQDIVTSKLRVFSEWKPLGGINPLLPDANDRLPKKRATIFPGWTVNRDGKYVNESNKQDVRDALTNYDIPENCKEKPDDCDNIDNIEKPPTEGPAAEAEAADGETPPVPVGVQVQSPTQSEQSEMVTTAKDDWEFEWIKLNNSDPVKKDETDYTHMYNIYTREKVAKDTAKAGNITENHCNILCHMTSKTNTEIYRKYYCFTTEGQKIRDVRKLQQFVIYFRHISNINNWKQMSTTDKNESVRGKYYYEYNKDMIATNIPCDYIPTAKGKPDDKRYFLVKVLNQQTNSYVDKNYFDLAELNGLTGLAANTEAMLSMFSLTPAKWLQYKQNEEAARNREANISAQNTIATARK
jgi:hypothetical protein